MRPYAAIVLAGLALPGCAAMVEADWQEHPSHAPLQSYHIELPDAQLGRACGERPGQYVFGCALLIPSDRICIILTRAHPAEWIMQHEQRHCDGWDHGTEKM